MKIIICVLLFVFAVNSKLVDGRATDAVTNSTSIECSGMGEYCQYHTDCCSRNCLTFSYKCVRSRNELPQIDEQPQVVATGADGMPLLLVNNIEELVNRFGNVDGYSMPAAITATSAAATTATFTISNVVPQSPTESSLLTTHHINNNHNNYKDNMHSGIATERVCLTNGFTCSTSAECCSKDCSLDRKRCGGRTPATCVTNGQKCYRDTECCSKKCHSYLNQCVS